MNKIEIGTQILYTYPEPIAEKVIKAIVIGFGIKDSIEVEWFDKEQRYHYMFIPKEYQDRIKVCGNKVGYIAKRIFNKFDIHTNEWLAKPTMEIVKEKIKQGLLRKKVVSTLSSLPKSTRKTSIITKKENKEEELSVNNVTNLINKRKEFKGKKS